MKHPYSTEYLRHFVTALAAVCATVASALCPLKAQAQSEASVAVSMLPVASVVAAVSIAGAATSAEVALPAAFSVTGAQLSVVAVQASAEGAVYVLERVSDGAKASVRVLGKAANDTSVVVGTAVTVSAISTGVLLLAAGKVLAFLPNTIGHALLHNEKLQ